MKNNKQDIVIIMDESGSMDDLGKEPLEAVNTFITTQKNITKNDKSTITLWKFNHEVKLVIDNELIDKTNYFNDFNPLGMTALYDAIGMAIDYKKDIDNVVCVIVTDGLENCSKEYSLKNIKSKINRQETNNNWKFVYLGANQDVFAVGNDIGLNLNRCASFAAHEGNGGLLDIVRNVSDSISKYRSASSNGVNTELKISQNSNSKHMGRSSRIAARIY